MAITISGGKKVTTAKDAVTVTVGATVTLKNGMKHSDVIAIQFSGTECHVVQIFMRTKVVNGNTSTDTIGVDSGGFNTFKFSDPATPDWLVDTTSAASPYYDFGYAGETVAKKYIMVDAPSMTGGKFDLPGKNDTTSFDAYDFCLSDKDLIAIVHWNLLRHFNKRAAPTAQIVHDMAWWDRLYLGRKVLTKGGYVADNYLPLGCMK